MSIEELQQVARAVGNLDRYKNSGRSALVRVRAVDDWIATENPHPVKHHLKDLYWATLQDRDALWMSVDSGHMRYFALNGTLYDREGRPVLGTLYETQPEARRSVKP